MQDLIVTLANGVRMPRLGFGTWQLDEATAERATALALRAGFRSIDTSEVYGNERGVGRAVRDSGLAREDVFVTTKVLDREGHDSTIRSFHASLQRLGLDHVDLYLIHWPQDETTTETWRAMERLYADRLVHAIGVSNTGRPERATGGPAGPGRCRRGVLSSIVIRSIGCSSSCRRR